MLIVLTTVLISVMLVSGGLGLSSLLVVGR